MLASIGVAKLRQRRQRHHGGLLGAQQLVVEIEIVVGRRDPLAEDIQQIAFEGIEGLGRGKTQHELATILGGDIKGVLRVFKAVAARRQCLQNRVIEGGEVGDLTIIQQSLVVAGGGEDLQPLFAGTALGADSPFGAHIENGADLFSTPEANSLSE